MKLKEVLENLTTNFVVNGSNNEGILGINSIDEKYLDREVVRKFLKKGLYKDYEIITIKL